MTLPRLPSLLLVAVPLLLSACASRGPLGDPASPPPRDFRLEVECEGAFNPHCDWRVEVSGDGSVAYRVNHRGRTPADRLGETRIAPDAVREIWRAVARSGIEGLPARLPPVPGQQERGVVTYAVTAAGRRAAVVSDHAPDPGLDRILNALFRSVPRDVWRIPGDTGP